MSADDTPENSGAQAGGLGEVIPEPLLPVWRRIELVQAFRRTHGETYVGALKTLTALVLAAGYGWWLLVFFGAV